MAQSSTPVKKAWRALIGLFVILAALAGIQGLGMALSNWGFWPRLALDLEGGTQLILTAELADGQQISAEQLDQAVSIIRQRVDGAGVSEAQISTEGDANVIVAIPGEPDQDTLDRIQASAKLDFRPVILADLPSSDTIDDGTIDETEATAEPVDTPTATPTDASDLSWVTEALQEEFDNFQCDSIDPIEAGNADPDEPFVTCDDLGQVKYLLGPVEVSGDRIADAEQDFRRTSSGASTGEAAVNIIFDGEGSDEFEEVTSRLYGLESPRNQFAVVLDGRVITAPQTNAVITDGKPQISGTFTVASAQALADQLKYGALPISFRLESQDTISATLGESQLASGLLAGLVGLILVVIYSFFQYRLLASVTIMSLVVAAAMTFLVIDIAGWHYGYRLSLAGIAGLIVAIGFTVDSFIVYFERIRDELRDGRGLTGAVEAGWSRALRTIMAAKGVNLLSAIVLTWLAVGSVRGFAITLGITVIIDVIVVVLFTHPVMQLLSQTRFFASGHPLSGLDPQALGAVYRGRAEFRFSKEARRSGAKREAQRRQTIAERKAAEEAERLGTKGKDS